MITYYNDNDPNCIRWLWTLFDTSGTDDWSVFSAQPIQNLDPYSIYPCDRVHLFAGIGGWQHALNMVNFPRDINIWTCSCPCQPFSNSGSKLGEKDERHLWPEMLRLVDECRPSIVFGEQVASKSGRDWLSVVRSDLEALGYAFGAADLCAAGVGAPHDRPRLYWGAYSDGFRQQESWKSRENPVNYTEGAYREADRLVDAVRRKAMPFLCGSHDGVSARVGEIALRGFGNAIVPQLAAKFIESFMDAICDA